MGWLLCPGSTASTRMCLTRYHRPLCTYTSRVCALEAIMNTVCTIVGQHAYLLHREYDYMYSKHACGQRRLEASN